MSLYLYFGGVTEDQEGMHKQLEDPSGRKPGYICHFHGVQVKNDSGVWRTDVYDLEDLVPEKIADLITHASVQDYINEGTNRPILRECGIYKGEGDTEAVIRGGSLRVYGSKLSDVRKLHRAILAGTIQPTESFERDQLTQSHTETEENLAAARDKCDQLEKALIKAQHNAAWLQGHVGERDLALSEAMEALYFLNDYLEGGHIVWCPALRKVLSEKLNKLHRVHVIRESLLAKK